MASRRGRHWYNQGMLLPRDSVANVSQIVTVDCDVLTERTGKLPPLVRERIDRGLRLVLGL
jgi:mRNA interferase MazF